MRLSIVIVNYNVKYFLEQVLYSVRKACMGLDAEVFVVDNHSVDGSVEMVRQKFPEVKLVANQENAGFSKANNQAIRMAAGEYVLLLNPDTVVEEDTFKKVIAFMDRTPNAGAVGVKMIDGKGRFLPESKRGLPTPQVAFYKMFGLSALFPKSKRFGRYHLGYLGSDKIHPVDVLAGAFMMIRKKVLDEIGLLDETFFMYGEDIDLSYRITKAGYKNYYFPETTIIHYKGESTKKTTVNYVFVFYRAMVIFARKHYSARLASSFSLLIHIAIYMRAGIALMHRMLSAIAIPLLDAAFIVGGMFYIKNYWEHNHKYVSGSGYGIELMLIYVPAYTCIWLLSCYANGVYSKENNSLKILRGIFSGTIIIAFLYAFLPENMRNSRALILLGAAWAALIMIFYRAVYHFIKKGSLAFGESYYRKTIIVGKPQEAGRVQELLKHSGARNSLVGFVGITREDQAAENYLGQVDALNEVITIFHIDEIIFCAKDISANKIIEWMSSISQPEIHFKIVPEESLFIIGSDSKDAPGDFYSIDISLSLGKERTQKQKRLFDIAVGLLLIPLSPLLIFLNKKPGIYIQNLGAVLSGKKTWVGYASAANENKLPKIRKGILSPLDEIKGHRPDASTCEKINFLYAKDYSLQRDLSIILKCLHKLGRPVSLSGN